MDATGDPLAAVYDRRAFLARAGLASAGALLLAGLPRGSAAADPTLLPFPHGVASGDPQSDRVILWTRVTPTHPGRLPVRWLVATDAALEDVVAQGTVRTDAERDWTVKVDATGLDPGREYHYAFDALGVRSPIGRTRTAPASDAATSRLRFGVASCANYQRGHFNAYARLAERDDLDAIIHLGDYLYEYGPDRARPELQRPHEPGHEVLTLADYRLRHAQYKLDPDLRRLHQRLPFITTWDDHESANGAFAGGAENHDPATEGDWHDRLQAARRAYDEWMPVRTTDPARIYRTANYGDLVDLIVLDTRLQGREQQGRQPLLVDDPHRRLLGEDQWAFLGAAIDESRATWQIIAQQVVVGQWNTPGLPRVETPDTPVVLVREGGNGLNPDAWDGYPAERDRLFERIREKRDGNVVLLTGDVHSSWALDLTEDPMNPLVYDPATGHGALGVELVAPAVSSDPLAGALGMVARGRGLPDVGAEAANPVTAAGLEAAFTALNPHVRYTETGSNGYLVLDVTPDRVEASWHYVDTVLQPSAGERLGAVREVRAGDRHLRRPD